MVLRGTNQELGRPFNRRIVLELVRLQGPLARSEIAQRTGSPCKPFRTSFGSWKRTALSCYRQRSPKAVAFRPAE